MAVRVKSSCCSLLLSESVFLLLQVIGTRDRAVIYGSRLPNHSSTPGVQQVIRKVLELVGVDIVSIQNVLSS